MSRDHKIRVLVSGLKGQKRQEAILKLLSNPSIINKRLGVRLRMLGRAQ